MAEILEEERVVSSTLQDIYHIDEKIIIYHTSFTSCNLFADVCWPRALLFVFIGDK